MFELTDDGTMDTVIRCSKCGEGIRFTYAFGPDDDQTYDDFVDECLELAAREHECQGELERD